MSPQEAEKQARSYSLRAKPLMRRYLVCYAIAQVASYMPLNTFLAYISTATKEKQIAEAERSKATYLWGALILE